MRKVKVFKTGDIDPQTKAPAKELDFIGELHCFESQTEFTAIGMIVSPVAIVEKPCGEVRIVPLQNLQFLPDDGWIKCTRGEMPVDGQTFVQVKQILEDKANMFDWDARFTCEYRVIE